MPLLLQIKSSVDPKKTEYQLRGESAGKVFRVDKNTGDVYALERLDREKISEYHLTALVVDKDSKKNLESPSSFTIKVHDVNDNWPVFTHRVFNASVPETRGQPPAFPRNPRGRWGFPGPTQGEG